MSVTIETSQRSVPQQMRERRLQTGSIADRFHRLRIGFVNNMPDASFATAERQFLGLIDAAGADYDIRLIPIALQTLPRSAATREAMAPTYRDPQYLRSASLDALIVTGAEPRSPDLAEEPFWAELTALIDWARGGVVSALYSCLAAHAVALHRDGVARRRLPRKLSGVYECKTLVDHDLTRGLTSVTVPHSRFNALAECDLEAKNYTILTYSPEAGPDVFIKDKGVLEVFWQGHPEYEAETLAREFRRDALRFVNHDWPRPPRPPDGYFDAAALARIESVMARARDEGTPSEVIAAGLDPASLAPASASWDASSTRLMGHWLREISRRKAEAAADTFARVRWGG